jgi:hypothetical protein
VVAAASGVARGGDHARGTRGVAGVFWLGSERDVTERSVAARG